MGVVRVLFTRRRAIGSLLIRGVTWSAFSHVEIVIGDHVIGANIPHGVSLTPIKERLAVSSYAALVDLPCADPVRVQQVAIDQLGKGYDYLGLLGILVHSDALQTPDKFFCSEFVAWSFREAGYPLLRPELIGRGTPQNLWMIPAPAITQGHPLELLSQFS